VEGIFRNERSRFSAWAIKINAAFQNIAGPDRPEVFAKGWRNEVPADLVLSFNYLSGAIFRERPSEPASDHEDARGEGKVN
jgi:hypothetical protein